MFERVEIIRGPASSLYGDSAFFAVVNVITRSGASLDGVVGDRRERDARHAARALEHRPPAARTGSTWRSRPPTSTATASAGCSSRPSIRPRRTTASPKGSTRRARSSSTDASTFGGLTVTSMYGTRRRDVPTASLGHAVQPADLARADDRPPRALRRRLRPLVRRHPPDGPRRRTTASPTPAPIRSPVEADGAPTLVGRTEGLGSRWSASTGVTRTLFAAATRCAPAPSSSTTCTRISAPASCGDADAVLRSAELVDAAGALRPERDARHVLAHRQRRAALRPLRAVRPGDAARRGHRAALVLAVVQVSLRRRLPRPQFLRAERRLLRRPRARRCAPRRSTRTSSSGSATSTTGCGPRSRPTGTRPTA